ncbi:MAG: hypothetical protein LC769_03600, partial [Chloroflexi bacterium]|nr:hypothetical protein [Chloroflexota bacterium]
TWYDAAERYKAWALTQPWTARGPLWSRDERCRWLLEDVSVRLASTRATTAPHGWPRSTASPGRPGCMLGNYVWEHFL